MDNYQAAYEDLYVREEKNPSKRRSGMQIFLSVLLPIIVLSLMALFGFQLWTLSKVGGTVAEEPDMLEVTAAGEGGAGE